MLERPVADGADDAMTVDIRCPQCGRFLAEVDTFGRAVCRDCGWEITVKDKVTRGFPVDIPAETPILKAKTTS